MLTALAVFLGVSMVCGTLVFTDTIRAAFRQQFVSAASGADVVVSSRVDEGSSISAPAPLPTSLIAQIRKLPGVAAANGQVRQPATIVGRNGGPVKSLGGSTVALSYLPAPFTGMTFVSGTRPSDSTQVALDEGTANREHLRVGDSVSIVTAQPARRFTITGLVRYGNASLGGSPFAVFDLSTARVLYNEQGEADVVYVAAVKGTTDAALVSEIGALLPPQFVARTPSSQVDAQLQGVSSQLSLLTGGLLAFGVLAVLIGAFVIFNTFSITVTQRTREFALLRALGATRSQVVAVVVLEAVTVGLIASSLGLAGGLGVAALIHALLLATGQGVPGAALVLTSRTVLVGLGVGVIVTVTAGLIPVWRATRSAPLDALLTNAAAPATRRGLRRLLPLAPAVVLALGGVALVFVVGGSATTRLTASAAGAVLLIVAVALVVPALVSRLGPIAAWPMRRGGDIVPELARDNITRNPARTAASASALMIGLALALFVTVYANGLRTSTRQVIGRTVLGDLTIESQSGSGLIPAATARVAAQVPGVTSVSTLTAAPARLGQSGYLSAAGVDPTTFPSVYRFDFIHGSAATIASLSPGQVLVEQDTARAANLHLGERTSLTTETGVRTDVTVAGIYRDQSLLRGFVLPLTQFDQLFHQQQLEAVFVKLGPGASTASAQAALNRGLQPFPGVVARSQEQLRQQAGNRANSVLLLFYGLLGMSLVMALLGIVNTLSLSIHERRRELGLLRAVGMTSEQARGMIRAESLITAAIGTFVGIVVGLALAWIVSRSLMSEGIVFAVPWLQLGLLLVLGLLAGVLAAIIPAGRAARLDVLAAIAHE